jgi:hypothetical protein
VESAKVNEVGQQHLNAADRAMRTVDRILRGMGCSGFETQMLVWLSGRSDAAALRTAITRLSAHYPVIASRLIEPAGERPNWRFRPGAECLLQEADLPSAEPAAVLEHAGHLLSQPANPAEVDPIRFHLLHQPNGQDVVLVQYNHALMDNNASALLLQEIDRLSRPTSAGADHKEGDGRDLIWEYLRRFPRERRRQAASNTLRLWGRSAKGGVMALGGGAASTGPVSVRIATRCLEQDATNALLARVIKTSGLPSLSMAVAASAFRAIGLLAPPNGAAGRNLLAGIGVDLGLRGRKGPIFQNLVSLVAVSARAEELDDRDSLVRLLNRQTRERIASDADLGMLQWVALLGRRPDADWLIEHLLRHGFSLWYGYFGSLDAVGESFCGAAIERIYYAGPAWPAVGLTLLVNQHRGRLLLQATYTPQSVPEALAERFLVQVIDDLVR